MEKKGRVVSDYRFDRKRSRRSSNNGTATIAGGAQANQYQVHVKIPPLRNEPLLQPSENSGGDSRPDLQLTILQLFLLLFWLNYEGRGEYGETM